MPSKCPLSSTQQASFETQRGKALEFYTRITIPQELAKNAGVQPHSDAGAAPEAAVSRDEGLIDDDIVQVIEAWETISAEAKSNIMAIIQRATSIE